MKKVLVVYYSRSGNTQRVARAVAEALGADFEPIVEARTRLGVRGWLRSGREAFTRQLAPIEPLLHDPSAYDLVVVGTPTWAASPSSPVRAFLTRHRSDLKAVAFFCTCGGRGADRVLREMASAAGKSPSDVLVLREHELRHDYSDKIARFVRELRLVLEPEPPRAVEAHAPS